MGEVRWWRCATDGGWKIAGHRRGYITSWVETVHECEMVEKIATKASLPCPSSEAHCSVDLEVGLNLSR